MKMNSDGRAYGGYCREIRIPMVGIRFHIIFVMLMPRGEGSCALEVMSVQTRQAIIVHSYFSFFFPFRTISSREARPVIAKTRNTLFLIERTDSVQSGGFLRAQALKFSFFSVSFSFGNEREENSARRANTARLRAIAKERYSRHAPSEHARCYVNGICC